MVAMAEAKANKMVSELKNGLNSILFYTEGILQETSMGNILRTQYIILHVTVMLKWVLQILFLYFKQEAIRYCDCLLLSVFQS